MVLLISNRWDVAVDFVVLELRRRGHPFVRLNAEELASAQATIALPDLKITMHRTNFNVDLQRDVKVIWNRRPGYPFDDMPSESRPSLALQRFVIQQWQIWRDALEIVPDITWVNSPSSEWIAENKIRQLTWAVELGFAIPNTLVSNDPTAIRTFRQRNDGQVIMKALYAPLIEEREEDRFIFTNLLPEIVSNDEPSIRLSPFIVQNKLPRKTDIRVTVVGSRLFAARIIDEAGGSVSLDWRTQSDGLRFEAYMLPSEIEDRCINYVRRCGLLFGAIDLIESDGDFYFLEINPNGEWGWLQKRANLPIAEALCDLFIDLDS